MSVQNEDDAIDLPVTEVDSRSPFKVEYVEQARKLCSILGATDFELGEFFGVSDRTIRTWKARHPTFREALTLGKAVADDRVERALYHRAIGYTFASEKVMQYEGAVVRADTVEHVPPDVNAAQYWLNNRKGYDWKSKVEHEHSGTLNIEALRQASERAAQG